MKVGTGSAKIWIAGEAEALCHFLRRGLESDVYEVQWMRGVAAVGAALRGQAPDLLILDLPIHDLPIHCRPAVPLPSLALSGIETPAVELADGGTADGGAAVVARQAGGPSGWQTGGPWGTVTTLRSVNPQVPMLVLIAGRDVEMRVECLDRGADDCMVKPLSLRELRARCRALLRRRSEASLVLRWEGVELDRMSHRVQHEGRPVQLTRTEFAVLEYLMMHRGSCVSRRAILEQVWTEGAPAGGNIVDVYVNYLRRKLGGGRAGAMIRTVRGRGYCVGDAQGT
jgi:DNA-binding response OmpR family regulator